MHDRYAQASTLESDLGYFSAWQRQHLPNIHYALG